jgi:hypothetical protein
VRDELERLMLVVAERVGQQAPVTYQRLRERLERR